MDIDVQKDEFQQKEGPDFETPETASLRRGKRLRRAQTRLWTSGLFRIAWTLGLTL